VHHPTHHASPHESHAKLPFSRPITRCLNSAHYLGPLVRHFNEATIWKRFPQTAFHSEPSIPPSQSVVKRNQA
jgi:hypothetical protein